MYLIIKLEIENKIVSLYGNLTKSGFSYSRIIGWTRLKTETDLIVKIAVSLKVIAVRKNNNAAIRLPADRFSRHIMYMYL